MPSNMHLSALELAQMKADNLALMMDTAEIHNRTDTVDSFGYPSPSYATTATISCGFEFSPFKFRSRELNTYGGEETSEILVRARVPSAYKDSIDTKDRLVLIKRFGVTLTNAETYEVQGFDEHGPAGLVLNLKRVEL